MTIVIAHRGASARYPENTVAAFAGAREMGAEMVELDVRRTAEGVLAVHHDAVLPGRGPLKHLSAGNLPRTVATLAEAVDACTGMRVNVEIKALPGEPDHDTWPALTEAVASLLATYNDAPRFLVSSFHRPTITRFRDLEPTIPTAWLTLPDVDQAAALRACVEGGHVALHPHHLGVTPALVARAHEAGVAINTWTVDDPARMAELASWGVDGIVTNVPDVLVGVLSR